MKEIKAQVTFYFLHLRSSCAALECGNQNWHSQQLRLREQSQNLLQGPVCGDFEAEVADETILGHYHGPLGHCWWAVSVSRLSTCIISCQQITSWSVALK